MEVLHRCLNGSGKLDSAKISSERSSLMNNAETCSDNSQLQGLHYSNRASYRKEASSNRRIAYKLDEILSCGENYEVRLK